MGIQHSNTMNHFDAHETEPTQARSCMAIIWVQHNSGTFDRTALLDAVKNMAGVSGAKFTREKPAIMMIDYCTRETRAAHLVEKITNLGAYARIVGC